MFESNASSHHPFRACMQFGHSVLEMEVVIVILLGLLAKLVLYLINNHLKARSKTDADRLGNTRKAAGASRSLHTVCTGHQTSGRSRILVTGGCGYLGREIVSQLYASLGGDSAAHSIVVLDLRVDQQRLHPGVTYLEGDLKLPSHVEPALKDCCLVLHVAAVMQAAGTAPADLISGNVNATRLLIESCLELDVPAFIFTSSAVVIVPERSPGPLAPPPSSPTVPQSERDPLPLRHVSLYAASKAAAERIVLGANSHILKTAVLRPGGIYGTADGQVVDVILRGWPYIGHGKSLMSMVWVRDAARAHVHAAHAMLGLPLPSHPREQSSRIHSQETPAGMSTSGSQRDAKNQRPSSKESASKVKVDERESKHGLVSGFGQCTIAGEVFNICNDGVTDPMMYGDMFGGNVCVIASKMAGGRQVNVWGQAPTWSVPFWFLDHATAWNEWLASTVGFAPLGRFATQAAIATATAHFPLQVDSAKALLKWEPTAWRLAVAEIMEERSLANAVARLSPRAKAANVSGRAKMD